MRAVGLLVAQGDVIVVCGVKHCAFYSLEGCNLTRRNAVMGSKGQLSKMMCIAWANNDAVIGTSTGKLYKFKEHQLHQVRKSSTLKCLSFGPMEK
jgi:hypothetical protein